VRPPIIWTTAYILACRAGTTSRYSTGEPPPIKAGRLELYLHLGSTLQRGNTSTRIRTRALQPVQEEVSSWRFSRAQTVSRPPTFSTDISLGAEISMPAKILYFCQTPIFCKSANNLCICHYFGRRQHFVIRQHFHETPIFWESAVIL
jgi:hypothetical protein